MKAITKERLFGVVYRICKLTIQLLVGLMVFGFLYDLMVARDNVHLENMNMLINSCAKTPGARVEMIASTGLNGGMQVTCNKVIPGEEKI